MTLLQKKMAKTREEVLDEAFTAAHTAVYEKVFRPHWKKITASDVSKTLYKCCYGSHDANWLTFFSFFRVVIKAPEVRKIEGMEIIAKSCGWWWPFNGMAILTDRPLWMDVNDENEFHSRDRKAIEWGDGHGYCFWNGIQVPSRIIEHSDEITAEEVINEDNLEIRRIMTEKCGIDRLLSAAKLIQEDDYGKLYRLSVRNDEDVVMVHVVNGTPEPDGTYSEYTLRVAPHTQTAHEGVAASYGMTVKEYQPILRT